MVLKIPQKHNFSDCLKKEISGRIRSSLPEWEISVPRKDDLAWSIVLSYLMSTNYKEKEDFARRVKVLTGKSDTAMLVKKSIRNFNPFRNRWSCFFDENLKTVVKEFIENLKRAKLMSVSDKLSTASKTLECPILLIKDSAKPENCQIFGKIPKNVHNFIVLIQFFSEDMDDSVITRIVYNFMIHNTVAQNMKRAALYYYLKETDMPNKVIKKLSQNVIKDDYFIKAILKSAYKLHILDVYKSPYVLSKLSEAGYEMDPKAKDSDGLCGLYYALVLDDPEILYKLYFFAADSCTQDEVSFRNPNANILLNLQCIEELLLDNISKLKDSNSNALYCVTKRKCEELLRLNRFLIQLNRKILDIKNRINYYESTSDLVFEAIRRRDVILTLLDIYENFFKYEDKLPLPTIDDYVFHKNYYLSVDMVTATIFFDNISFLKERLQITDDDVKEDAKHKNLEELKNKEIFKNNDDLQKFKGHKDLKKNSKKFSEIESSFFFSVLYNVIFQQMEKLRTVTNVRYSLLRTIYTFPLKYRFDNHSKLSNFRSILQNIAINDDNVIDHIPESEFYSIFQSHPVIKDCLELERLKTYIKITRKLRITDIKSVLVIERVLQVIGECLAPEEDDFSFRRLLSLCIPKQMERILRRLRNALTHLDCSLFPAKFENEKNFSLFRSILYEIRGIESYFRPVYRILTLSACEYLFGKFKKEIEDLLDSSSSSFLDVTILKETAIACDQTMNKYFQQIKPRCHDFFKIAIENVKSELEEVYLLENINDEDQRKKIIYLLWPVKWFLELLQRCGMESVWNLLDSFNEVESELVDLRSNVKEKVNIFINRCFDFLPKFDVIEEKTKPRMKKSVKHITRLLEILKGCVYLSDEEKDEIRKEIPEAFKKDVIIKNVLIQSIEDETYLKIDTYPAEYEISYLSKTKMKYLREYYESRDSYALTILKTQDPIEELEEIFQNNSVDMKKYDALCKTMQFSEKTKKKLFKIAAGQRKKPIVNKLESLLNRINMLKKIVIEEDEEMQRLWLTIKRESSKQLIVEKVVRRYLKDLPFQAAVEMLLLDCMILYEKEKLSKKLWKKSSKLYQGINIRNIISHGNPLVENLCMTLDPQELPSEIVKKILILIKDADAIEAILELHKCVNENFTKVNEIIHCDENNEHYELRDKITNCDDWNIYVILLPDSHRKKLL